MRNLEPSGLAAVVVLACCAVAYSSPLSAQARGGASQIALRANPEVVCFTGRHPQYLNFDIVVKNDGPSEIKVKELRALVLDGFEVVERRLIWAQALDLLGPARIIPARSEAILFNPLIFNSLKSGRGVKFEFEFQNGDSRTAELTVEPSECRTSTDLLLPLVGRIHVLDGYDLFSHHRRADYSHPSFKEFGVHDNTQRFGLDLVVIDAAGRIFRRNGTRNEDWFGWGQPVRAPADWTVFAIYDDQPDNTIIGSENLWVDRSVRKNEMTSSGNYVLIDHGLSEFSLLAHLREGSVRVQPGDKVEAGEAVAEVGNSGASIMPHVHYELRSGWGVRGIRTAPAYFRNLRVVGTGEGAAGESVALDTGDVVVAQ